MTEGLGSNFCNHVVKRVVEYIEADLKRTRYELEVYKKYYPQNLKRCESCLLPYSYDNVTVSPYLIAISPGFNDYWTCGNGQYCNYTIIMCGRNGCTVSKDTPLCVNCEKYTCKRCVLSKPQVEGEAYMCLSCKQFEAHKKRNKLT